MWKGGKKQKPSGAQYRKKRRDLEIAVLRNSQTLPELFKARMQTDHEKVNELSKGVHRHKILIKNNRIQS